MRLYHFTAISSVPNILDVGILPGELPISAREVARAVNLTTDASPSGHGLTNGRFVSKAEAKFLGLVLTEKCKIPHFPNKRKVRMTVDVDSRSVHRWLRWSQANNHPRFRETMIASGGGLAKAKTWRFCWETIPPDQIEKVEVKTASDWTLYENYNGSQENEFLPPVLVGGYNEWGPRLFNERSQEFIEAVGEAMALRGDRRLLPAS